MNEIVRILLVEDNPEDGLLVRQRLEEAWGGPCSLETVDRLGAALERLSTGGINLILLDLGLPDSTGPATFAAVHAAARDIPIIILTAVKDESLALRMVRGGAQDYLVKGQGETEGDVLSRAIRHAVERNGAAMANTELSRRGRELQDYIDAMSTLNLKLAPDGTILLVNRAAQAATGVPLDRLINTNFLEGRWWTFDTEVRARVHDAFRQACSGRSVSYEERMLLFGKVLSINFSLVPIVGADGAVAYIVAEAGDITRRVEAAETLQEVNQELEAFTYSVSHDLRAPLRQIDGFGRILTEHAGAGLDAKSQHYLRRIHEGTQHMGRLVDDLLRLAQLGRQELRTRPTQLNGLVRASIVGLRGETADRVIEWKLGSLPTVQCDPGLMQIVLTNLLSNALKYTRPRERTTIEVTSTTDDGRTVVSVRDNGVGFNMKYADKLFGVFQRLHRADQFEGSGVGLATVKRIIHKHGGEIWAEAELGTGAAFHFTVELAEAVTATARAS